MPKIRLGTAGWAIPRRLAHEFNAEGSALVRYAARFCAAEINSTFHRSHQPRTLARWAASVPEEFRFAVKMPKVITHGLRLEGTADVLATFLEDARNLSPKTGPFLLQLPPSLAYNQSVASRFFALLRTYTSHDVVCEPRHPSWFEEDANTLLISFGIARVASDPARVAEAARAGGIRTIEYYRLHGAPRMYYSAYEPTFLSKLTNTIAQSSASEIWCIFDNTASGAATVNALEIQTRLNFFSRWKLKPHKGFPDAEECE